MTRILAIDDNNDNLITLGVIIKDSVPDLTFDTASSGKKGIELAISSNPDVILLGVNMPDMDGFEICRSLKQDECSCDIPVVFITTLEKTNKTELKRLMLAEKAFGTNPLMQPNLFP